VAVLVAGSTGCTSDGSTPEPAPSQTPLTAVDLSGLQVTRSDFCDAVDEGAVIAVLGGQPSASSSYGNGDRVRLTPKVRDVAHEYGCTWRRHRVTARTWVFAEPVTPGRGRTLVAARADTEGCSPAGELQFGSPGSVLVCAAGGSRTVTMAGLFGTAWLTCEVTAPRADAAPGRLEAAQRWCADVATAAALP